MITQPFHHTVMRLEVSIYDTKAVLLDFRLPASRTMGKISLLLEGPPDMGILTQQREQTRQ